VFRGLAEFREEVVVLLMDNGAIHVAADMLRFLTEVRVRVLAFAPYTTQIFNVLALTLSGVLKRFFRHELASRDGNATLTFKMQAYHDFGEVVVEPNVLTACCALHLIATREGNQINSY
jgi:hypothetical protein